MKDHAGRSAFRAGAYRIARRLPRRARWSTFEPARSLPPFPVDNAAMNSGETPLKESARTSRDAPPVEAGIVAFAAAAPPLTEQQQKARRWAVRWGVVAVIMVVLYTAIGGTEWAPDYALVARDEQAKVYFSPSCAFGHGNLPISSISAARHDGFRADSACAKNGGFLGDSQTRMEEVLSWVHLYPKRGTRWRADGSWKW